MDPRAFGVDFLLALASEADYQQHPWIKSNISPHLDNAQSSLHAFFHDFDSSLANEVLSWLSDVRQFQASDIGFERLMNWLEQSERYQHFARNYLSKAFVPADFAAQSKCQTEPEAQANYS